MSPPKKPSAGQPIIPFISNAGMWSTLVDMMADYKRGKLTNTSRRVGNPTSIIGRAAEDTDAGVIQQISEIVKPSETVTNTAVLNMLNRKPVFELIDPVWHTAIDNLVVLNKPLPAGMPAAVNRSRFMPVAITVEDETHRFVMLDPENPTQLKSATSGIYRIYGTYDDSTAILDTQQAQPLWRYKLTQESRAPSTTTAKLYNLDGVEFSTEPINLSDPLSLMNDQVTDDLGFCIHIGNEFHAIQGPC